MKRILLRAVVPLLLSALLMGAVPGASAAETDPSDGSAVTADDSYTLPSPASQDPAVETSDEVLFPGLDAANGEEDGRIWLSSTTDYDTLTHDFVYTMGTSDVEFHASVADGMVVTTPVRLTGSGLTVYNAGTEYTGDLTEISEPGQYVVMGQSGSSNARLLTFTILGETSNVLHSFTVPDGMILVSATRDGESLDFTRYSVSMEEDGRYHIEYECVPTGITYVLETTVDRTPPELQFSGRIDDNHRVYSALAFSNVREGEHINVTLDGEPIQVTVANDGTGELLQSGNYIIRAYDEAGNMSEYGYIIMVYLNASSMAFFGLLIATVAAVAIYIIIKRKKLKIG